MATTTGTTSIWPPYLHEASQCMGCGTCLHSCPVYGQELREELSARGRNNRIQSLLNMRGDTDALADLSRCLLCGRCTMVCPRGLRNDLVVAELRRLAVEKTGLPAGKKLAFRVLLKDRKALGALLRIAAPFQGIVPRTATVQVGLAGQNSETTPIRHLPELLPRFAKGRHIPSIAKKFLSELLPEINDAPGETTLGKTPLTVLYFSGCATEFFLPETGRAVVRLLHEAGINVVFPKSQGCCGLAVHANGDGKTARAMALHNVAVFEKYQADLIVTGCATCGSAMRDLWPTLAGTTEEKSLLKAVAAKVRDVSEVILAAADQVNFSCQSNLPKGARVTWHEPCHLARIQKVSREPLTILRRTFTEDFQELETQGCCGFGGSFNLYNYDLSRDIGAEKAASLRKSGADHIVTACPGCLIQLADTMARHGLAGKIVHLAEAVTFRK